MIKYYNYINLLLFLIIEYYYNKYLFFLLFLILWQMFLRQLLDFMVIILVVSAGVSAGNLQDSFFHFS